MIDRNNETGEIIFSQDESSELRSATKEVLKTPIGRQYIADFRTDESAEADADLWLQTAIQVAEDLTGQPLISVSTLEHALSLLMDSGKLRRRDLIPSELLEEPVEDTRPRDKNGKLLTESQLRYQEYRVWSETASVDERKLRVSTDSGYASYVRKAYRDEMDQPIDGAVTPAGQPTAKATQSLREFARKYVVEQTYNLRPKGGLVTLAGEQIPYPRFIELVNQATAAGLL